LVHFSSFWYIVCRRKIWQPCCGLRFGASFPTCFSRKVDSMTFAFLMCLYHGSYLIREKTWIARTQIFFSIYFFGDTKLTSCMQLFQLFKYGHLKKDLKSSLPCFVLQVFNEFCVLSLIPIKINENCIIDLAA
jgi:hypothetical protein